MIGGRKLVQSERVRDTSFHGAAADERAFRNHLLAKIKNNPFAPNGYILIVPNYNEKGIVWPHHLTIARLLSVCGRRRNLSLLHKRRGFYFRWLRMCERGVLKYLESVDKDGNWHDLRTRKHGAASKAYSTFPTQMQSPEVNAMILLAAVADEIGAVGNFWVGDPITEPEPLPMPSPDADKEGSGGDGSAGAAGSSAGMPKPRPDADMAEGLRVIELTEEELAELLDENLPTPFGGMFL